MPAMIQVMHMLIKVGWRRAVFASRNVITRMGSAMWSATIWKAKYTDKSSCPPLDSLIPGKLSEIG